MSDLITLETVTSSEEFPPGILKMCNAAYEGNLEPMWRDFGRRVHAVGRLDGRIVSHAMWVRHDLQPARLPRLQTAYIEGVATLHEYRHRGYATQVLEHLLAQLPDEIELAALSPSDIGFYEKMGWALWRGPLQVQLPSGELQHTPEDELMVKLLPTTPTLDFDSVMSAQWRPGEVW